MTLKDKRILVVSPHPDDDAICSGGLIMLAKKEKAEVYVLYMAIGDSRQFMNGKTRAVDRVNEAKQAAKYGGYEFMIITEESTKLDTFPQKTLIQAIEDINRRFKPDIVIMPNRTSFNQDHRACATATITAFRPMPSDLLPQPKLILEMEEPYTWGTEDFTPNFFIDITTVMDEKIELYNFHTSQVPQGLHNTSPRSVYNLVRLAGLRGSAISTKYAEGYRLVKGQLE